MNKPKIVLLGTGGTIVSSGASETQMTGYSIQDVQVSDIVRAVPSLKEVAELEFVSVCNIPSSCINASIWFDLARACQKACDDESVTGVVITHGTDTMEETAFFLNLTIHTHMPVVLTGSMRPATAASADGPMNLYQAVALAASDQAKGAGVLAVFSDTIYSGRDIRKSNSYKTDAFEIGHFGSLGYMRDDQVYFLSQSQRPHTLTSPFSDMEIQKLPKVGITYWHCDADLKILDYMAQEYEGIVTAGSGSGNYGSAWKEHFHKLAKEHVIVRSSRVAQGIVFDSSFFDPERDTISTTGFMSSSDSSFAVTETSQEQGTFTLGAVAEETISSSTGGDADSEDTDSSDDSSDEDAAENVTSRLTVISAGSLIDSQITDAFSQLENTQVFMNAVTANFDGVQNLSIEAKSLQTEYNTVQHAGSFSFLVIFGIPAVVLIAGFVVWFRRRKA